MSSTPSSPALPLTCSYSSSFLLIIIISNSNSGSNRSIRSPRNSSGSSSLSLIPAGATEMTIPVEKKKERLTRCWWRMCLYMGKEKPKNMEMFGLYRTRRRDSKIELV